MTSIARRLSALCIALFCIAAGGSAPTFTLIVGPGVALGPLQGSGPNLYTSVSGLITDLNGDGLPDIVIGLNGVPPSVYLNNGTATPFANVLGVMVAAPPGPTMRREWE